MKDVMLDLEFMGLPPAARMISIGACYFDPKTGEIGDTFYTRVAWAGPEDQTLPMNPSTVNWWLKQEVAATQEVTDPTGRLQLKDALTFFTNFLGKKVRVWGNGSDCDCVILDAAYKSEGMEVPWKFYNTRDVRTILHVCEEVIGVDPKSLVDFKGTRHHALDDAVYQAQYVSKCMDLISKGA